MVELYRFDRERARKRHIRKASYTQASYKPQGR
jgi:hypothetical protein